MAFLWVCKIGTLTCPYGSLQGLLWLSPRAHLCNITLRGSRRAELQCVCVQFYVEQHEVTSNEVDNTEDGFEHLFLETDTDFSAFSTLH